MNEQTRKDCITSLDTILHKAEQTMQSLDSLVDRHTIYQDKSQQAQRIYAACNVAHILAREIREASESLKEQGADYIRSTVIGWYRSLHWDITPITRIEEEEVKDPEIESIKYLETDKWGVIMTTPTHGRERVIIISDGATWQEVYSADPC